MCVTASMSASPRSNEAQESDLEIADISRDPEQQKKFVERSRISGSASFDLSGKQENLTATDASVTGEGAQLSKRALKRV